MPDTTKHESSAVARPTRRGFFAVASQFLGFLLMLAVAIPGVAFLIDPLRREPKEGRFRRLPITLNDLVAGDPRSVAVVEERTDAWVKYPAEPVGTKALSHRLWPSLPNAPISAAPLASPAIARDSSAPVIKARSSSMVRP